MCIAIILQVLKIDCHCVSVSLESIIVTSVWSRCRFSIYLWNLFLLLLQTNGNQPNESKHESDQSASDAFPQLDLREHYMVDNETGKRNNSCIRLEQHVKEKVFYHFSFYSAV